jgi:hypothetical protein
LLFDFLVVLVSSTPTPLHFYTFHTLLTFSWSCIPYIASCFCFNSKLKTKHSKLLRASVPCLPRRSPWGTKSGPLNACPELVEGLYAIFNFNQTRIVLLSKIRKK